MKFVTETRTYELFRTTNAGTVRKILNNNPHFFKDTYYRFRDGKVERFPDIHAIVNFIGLNSNRKVDILKLTSRYAYDAR